MRLVCLSALSRCCQHFSTHTAVRSWFPRGRLFVSVSGLKYTRNYPGLLKLKCICYQYQQKHQARKDLVYFPPQKRIPKRFEEEIEAVLELHHEKIEHLAAEFRCDVSEIENIIRQDTRIVTAFNFEDVLEKMKLIVGYGFSFHDIMSYAAVFARSLEELKRRLHEMHEIRKMCSILRPAILPSTAYKNYMEQMQKEAALIGSHPSRDSYVASLLGCSETELKSLAEKGHRHLLTKKPSQIKQLVELLLTHGFSLDEIRQNPGMLLASVRLARQRLQRMSELGLVLKEHIVFILTTSDDNVEAVIPNWVREKEALGPHATRKQFLMARLGLDEFQYGELTRRAPVVREMNARRLQQVLGVLLDDMGLTPLDILAHPSLLFYSRHRLATRWRILQDAGVGSKVLLIRQLKLSEADFTERYPNAQ